MRNIHLSITHSSADGQNQAVASGQWQQWEKAARVYTIDTIDKNGCSAVPERALSLSTVPQMEDYFMGYL